MVRCYYNLTGASKINGLMDSNAFDISVIRIWNVCSADSYCGSSTECVSYSVLSFVQSPEETQVEFWLLIWVFEVRTLGNLC